MFENSKKVCITEKNLEFIDNLDRHCIPKLVFKKLQLILFNKNNLLNICV